MAKIERKKIWTALALIPPLIFLIGWGPPALFAILVFITILIGLFEFYTLTLPQAKQIQRMAGIGLGLLLSISFVYGELKHFAPFLALIIFLLCAFYLMTVENLPSVVSHLGTTLFGMFYVGFLLSHIILIRNRTGGGEWVLFLILTIWAGDIIALFGGMLFGKHKLYPKISPNKTYEGLLGAVIGSVVIGLLYASFFLPELGKGACLLITIALGFLGQLGDFTESMIKRSAQVKDSGTLFPGHGGVLDRIDSFLFSTPFFYHLLPLLLKEPR